MAKRGRKEKDNWKKKRRQEYLEKKEFRYYIFCEGQATEPKYFQGFKRYIEDNPIYRDMVLIEIEGCQAETMRVIGKAEEYVRENKITKGQIWCVYDKDSFPSSDVNGVVQRAEVLNQKNPDIQYHAAWSNECIEFWFMLHFAYYTANNHRSEYSELQAQKELTESSEELYYPILDRIHESLHEKYIKGLYKKKTESPYSVTIGNNLDQYGEMLASSLIVSMYNGSLTHILLIYEKIRDFVFYLSCKYDDWKFRLNLYKLSIFAGKEKEINGIQDSYPEVLNNLTADEAESIMDFCLNHPIKYKRLCSQLLAFGSVGYFLDDECYERYEKSIVDEIKLWLNSDNPVVVIGENIFKCLSGVSYRMSQDMLSEICCQFIDKHYSRWYTDMFKFIANHIDLREMSNDSANELVRHINCVLDNEKEREQIKYSPLFLCVLRRQNYAITEEMDKKIAEYLPSYYGDTYRLEITENENEDMPGFVREYAERIRKSNETQGKNGIFFGHGTREIATVRAILLEKEFVCDSEIIDVLISTVADTLLIFKGKYRYKT